MLGKISQPHTPYQKEMTFKQSGFKLGGQVILVRKYTSHTEFFCRLVLMQLILSLNLRCSCESGQYNDRDDLVFSIRNSINDSFGTAPKQEDASDSPTAAFAEKAPKGSNNYSSLEWDPSKPPSVGSPIVLSESNSERYQKWEKMHQVC